MTALRVAVAVSAVSADGVEFVTEAERLGAHGAWSAELWGYDALTQLGYLAARTSSIALGTSIVQLGARTPAMLAMSAMSLQQLSGGRFRLGIGASGPQVMEGWHGVRFRQPVQATRETIEIIRMISRGDRLDYHGQVYDLPLPASQGRAIRSMAAPVPVPVYIAAIGPANLRLTGEVADGWLGNAFIPESAEAFLAPLRAGYAFTIGAMGSATTNFYNDAFARQGFGEQVAQVQRLWRDGRRDEAARLVPREIGRGTNLLGTPAMVRDRIRLHRDAGVTTLSAKLDGPLRARLDALAQLLDLVGEVNQEPAGPPVSRA